MFDPKSGKLEKRRRKNPDTGEVDLLPLERKAASKLPCWNCAKCENPDPKKRSPEDGKGAELSAKNWAALRFYWQQKAVGGPVDALARKNCGLIEWLLAQHRSLQSQTMIELLKVR